MGNPLHARLGQPRISPTENLSHTPGPWKAINVAGAGLQIQATMPEDFIFGEGTILKGTEVKVYGLPENLSVRQDGNMLIAYEKWTRFEPDKWNEMQQANADLIAAAPDLLSALKSLRNEAAGALGFAKQYLIDGLGETNIRCIENRIAEADTAIAKALGSKRECACCGQPCLPYQELCGKCKAANVPEPTKTNLCPECGKDPFENPICGK